MTIEWITISLVPIAGLGLEFMTGGNAPSINSDVRASIRAAIAASQQALAAQRLQMVSN